LDADIVPFELPDPSRIFPGGEHYCTDKRVSTQLRFNQHRIPKRGIGRASGSSRASSGCTLGLEGQELGIEENMKNLIDPLRRMNGNNNGKKNVTHRANANVFAQGDSADAVFYLRNGAVKYLVRSKKGKRAIIAVFNRGDFFGMGAIAGRAFRGATATAITDCSLTKVAAPEMLRLLETQPKLSQFFTRNLLSRVHRYQEDLTDLRINSSEKRLARVLLLLAQFEKKNRTKDIVPKLSQGDLAEMVGTTRSRINHFMNRFRKLGLIDYHRDIKVHKSLHDHVVFDHADSRDDGFWLAAPRLATGILRG
jgi:CRP/FNR family cyclic AMP-dependent transcriptional regulator